MKTQEEFMPEDILEYQEIEHGEKSSKREGAGMYITYLFCGILFGFILLKAEVISWFRIQEMFRFQSFHMYGILMSAIATGVISVQLIKRFKIRSFSGEEIVIPAKTFKKGQIYGGMIFGMGWAITGACPGPLFAQIGGGFTVVIITLLSAIAGTWVYGKFSDKLNG